ncbi:MAG: PEP-CTERM sorting domain-containing protein [Bryobacterales bacterium]
MHRPTKLLLAVALVMSVGGLTAGMIDFDDAASGVAYNSASDSGVTVSFYTGDNALVCPPCVPGVELGDAYGAEPDSADLTTTAFQVGDSRDFASGGSDSGFLTDEPVGPVLALDYFFSFNVGLTDLSVDVLDYRGDGGAAPLATVTLETYSSLDWTGPAVGTATFDLLAVQADGFVFTLTDLGGGGLPIRTARVTFSTPDIGTGIDNLSWTTGTEIPEPGTVILFGTGLLALGAIVRKRRTSQA